MRTASTLNSEDRALNSARTRFDDYLRRNKMRRTPERVAILEYVFKYSSVFSVDQFHRSMEADGYHVSLATVYNTFGLLCEAGIIRATRRDGSERSYERMSPSGNARIRLVCTDCGRERDIRDAEMAVTIGRHRFSSFTTHHFSLAVFGQCSRCRRREIKEHDKTNSKNNKL